MHWFKLPRFSKAVNPTKCRPWNSGDRDDIANEICRDANYTITISASIDELNSFKEAYSLALIVFWNSEFRVTISKPNIFLWQDFQLKAKLDNHRFEYIFVEPVTWEWNFYK